MAADNQSEVDEKSNELLKQREDVEKTNCIFEGELFRTSFYGSTFNGWDRSAMSVTLCRATPEMLNRKTIDSASCLVQQYRSRGERQEAADQENRNHGQLSRANSMASDNTGDTKRKGTSSPNSLSTKMRYRLSDGKN